jgi:hypothetical protein
MAATLASLLCRSRPTTARSAFKKLVCATVPHNSSVRTSMIAMQRKPYVRKPHSTNVLDYPCLMSGFERESLAAEAKLKVKVVLTIRCPTCGAARGVRCRLSTGLLRKTSHRDRRLVAKGNS